MAARAAGRMAKLKELMNLHMTSANDAFRFVSILHLCALLFEFAEIWINFDRFNLGHLNRDLNYSAFLM